MSAKRKLLPPTLEQEAAIQAGIAQDSENPEWTAMDVAQASMPGTEFPSADEVKAARKVAISIRLDRDVLEKLRASGPNWQSRVNDLLRRYA